MLDDMLDHLASLRERPVWRPIPDDVRGRLNEPLPTAPGDLAQAHAMFMADVLPYAGGNLHPGFMGWVQGAGTPVGMLAEMLAGGLNANLGGRDHMPIEVERQVGRWARQMFGFPESSTGLFVAGASMANFIGVLAARTRALGPSSRTEGLMGGHDLVAYASRASHGCIVRAMEMAGLGSSRLRLVPVNDRHQIDLGVLRAILAADRSCGLRPFLLIGNAGTVDAGAIDDLDAMADIAAAEQMFFHVDGAYGALGVLAPAIAPRLKGMERADCIAFDFHKWGQVPYNAGFVIARDEAELRATFASPAAYLQRDVRGMAGGDWWPCDYGPDLSRGFAALKAWFTFKVHGAEALGDAIERSCELARALERRITAAPELELLAPVQLNIVCFRYRAPDSDRVNRAIVADLHEAGVVAPSLTTIGGHAAIRAALFNHRTEAADIDALIDSVLALGRAAAGEAAA